MTDDKDSREPMSEEPEASPIGMADEPSGGANAAGEAAEDETGVAADVDALRAELESLNDQHLRLAAEFDNYRKRNERERQALATRLQADLVASLLDVLDDLQRVAASSDDARVQTVLEGVRLVEKKFEGILEAAGVEPLEVEGAPFDPEVMEALMTVPTDEPERDHHVAEVFQRGYRFRDRLLRPARVRVWQYDEPGSNG